jgi:hypothetical protein
MEAQAVIITAQPNAASAFPAGIFMQKTTDYQNARGYPAVETVATENCPIA